MTDMYIFSVGKPDLGAESVRIIHSLGFKAGLFLGSNEKTKHFDAYDIVIRVNFHNLNDEFAMLEDLMGRVLGLITTYENYIVSLSRLGTFFGVATLSEEAALKSTDKALMRQSFIEYDPYITPQYRVISSLEEAQAFVESAGFPVIIKPTNLVKSLLVSKCNNMEELVHNFTTAEREIGGLYEKYHIFDREPLLIIEEFVIGDMYSLAAFIDSRGSPVFCPGVTGLITAQNRGIDDNYLYRRTLPAQLHHRLESELHQVATSGIKALDLRSTPAHIELIAGENGVKLVEIGARVGGYRPRLYKKSYGIDMNELEVRNAIHEPLSLETRTRSFTSVFELFPSKVGEFRSVIGMTDEKRAHYDYYKLKTKPGQIVGPAKDGYKAALVVIVTDDDRDQFEFLCQSVDTLSIEVAS